MSDPPRGSAPPRDLEGTQDDLAQATIALDDVYDQLQNLSTSILNLNAQRNRHAAHTRTSNSESMHPNHSAIVLSESDEESEVDFEFLRESLPARLLELTSRWGHQHARLNATTRQVASSQSHNDAPTAVTRTSSSDDPRTVYPPPRRRRPPHPAMSSSRDSGMTTPPAASPARRSILEAHFRQMRHSSNPSEPSTTLGRRVAQRTAARNASHEHRPSGTGTVAPPDTIIHSTLPLGLEPRPSTANFGYTSPHGIESRAAAHLRHSLLPNPPAGIRSPSSSRIITGGPAYPRFGDRAEHRPRTARSNSLTALTRGSTSTSQSSTSDASAQTPLSWRLGELRATMMPMSRDEVARLNGDDPGDPMSASYRVRRRLNSRGEEQVFNINWNELMSEGERDEDLSDPAAWMRPPRQSVRLRPDRPRGQLEPDTDDTVGHDSASREIHPIGRDGGVQRRRGWARLDADGDEISTEDEATLEQIRTEARLPRTRNWARGGTPWAVGRGSTVAVLDFVHHNSRDATTGHRELNPSPGGGAGDTAAAQNESHRVLKSLFHLDASVGYVNPLPVSDSVCLQTQPCMKEVQVAANGRTAGR